MDVWTFLWLMVFLKIPIVGLFLIVRWAVRQTPETAEGGDGGIGPMPPSSPGAVSGAWRTAHRTSRNSATIGSFRNTTSQMNVHVSTGFDRIPRAPSVQPPIWHPRDDGRGLRTTDPLETLDLPEKRSITAAGRTRRPLRGCR